MRLPGRHDFATFTDTLGQVADSWENLSLGESTLKVMTPYQFMAEKVIERTADAHGDLHPKLTNGNALHGALVLGRYCNIAALLANREGQGKPQLLETLENPTSFKTLAAVASVQSDVAVKIENELGIRGYYTEDELIAYKLHHWVLNESGGIVVPDIETITLDSAMKTRDLDLTRKHECAAHRNHMLDKIYHQFVRICANDPLLFDRTLSRASVAA